MKIIIFYVFMILACLAIIATFQLTIEKQEKKTEVHLFRIIETDQSLKFLKIFECKDCSIIADDGVIHIQHADSTYYFQGEFIFKKFNK